MTKGYMRAWGVVAGYIMHGNTDAVLVRLTKQKFMLYIQTTKRDETKCRLHELSDYMLDYSMQRAIIKIVNVKFKTNDRD